MFSHHFAWISIAIVLLNNSNPLPTHFRCYLAWYVNSQIVLALQFISHYVINRCPSWSVTSNVTSLRVCWRLVTVCPLIQFFHSKVCSCVTSLCSSDKSMWHFTKLHNQRRELTNKDGSAPKKWKVATLNLNNWMSWRFENSVRQVKIG